MSDLSILSGVSYAGPGTQNAPRTYYGLSSDAWARIGVLALLMIGLFWPNLRRLWLKTNPVTGQANWGHAFFIPLIGIYYLYLNREALLKAPIRSSPLKIPLTEIFWVNSRAWSAAQILWKGLWVCLAAFGYLSLGPTIAFVITLIVGALVLARYLPSNLLGLLIMAGGILLYGYGIWPGQNDFVKDFAMVITLFGLVLLMCGWEVMKIAWFPIVFLICALPWPDLFYSRVALPLQQIAAASAIKVLNLLGVESYREGTKLIIVNGLKLRVLNVAEACAGLKSLMTFISVGAAVGFLSSRATWQKILITVSAIPIAIFCNMMRVTGQGIIDHYWSEKLSEGFAHQFVGMVMLIPAFFLILMVAWVLDNAFIEEADKRDLPAPGSRSTLIEIPRTAGPKGPTASAVAAAVQLKPQLSPALITAPVMTQAPITAAAVAAKAAPAPQVRTAPVAKPAVAPAPVMKPAATAAPAVKPVAPKPAAAPAAPAGNDLAAATARLTAASIRRPKPTTPPAPQPNAPKKPEGK